MQTGVSRLVHYETGADDRTVWGLGLGCNGEVDILVQPATDPGMLAALLDIRTRLEGASGFAIITTIDGGGPGGTRVADLPLRATRPGLERRGSDTVFTEVLTPPPHLILCGAGDDSRPLAACASEAGFAVVVVDHREAFLAPSRFPSAKRRLCLRADAAPGHLVITPETLTVVKTHSFAHDREWLEFFLRTPASYIGLLGPRARADELLALLGVVSDPRIYAPVGLNLGADGPEQIAISIVGELLAVLARQQPGHLRERGLAIHAR
jgi:xanthine/CO dehydrogenase XdhC/CoxF family maturation factor